MSNIVIKKAGITDLDCDCIVNAANTGLRAGSGVCGAIFRAAGYDELTEACGRIGYCDTGKAVITPGFRLQADYVIHTPGPIWNGGGNREPELLYSCYRSSLELMKENECHSIGFPLISAGIYGYPKKQAWERAITACKDFLRDNPEWDTEIVFAILEDGILKMGEEELKKQSL